VSVLRPRDELSRKFLPSSILLLIEKLVKANLVPDCKPPKQISVNVYENGRHGIVAHKDGPGLQALILTLGSGALTDFYQIPCKKPLEHTEIFQLDEDEKRGEKYAGSIYQEPNALLVLSQESYHEHAHSIEASTVDIISESTTLNFALLACSTRGCHDEKEKVEANKKSHVGEGLKSKPSSILQLERGLRVSIVMWS